MYMTDGYGNARVHKFSADGRHQFSWGEPGTGPGQFNLPHGIWYDRRGRLMVADRENNRVQIFDLDGKLQTIWPTDPLQTAKIRGFIPIGRSDLASMYDKSLPPGLVLGTDHDNADG